MTNTVTNANDTKNSFIYNDIRFGSAMGFLENLENSIFKKELPFSWPKEGCYFQQSSTESENNDAWDNEGGLITQEVVEKYTERIKYMEEHGI